MIGILVVILQPWYSGCYFGTLVGWLLFATLAGWLLFCNPSILVVILQPWLVAGLVEPWSSWSFPVEAAWLPI